MRARVGHNCNNYLRGNRGVGYQVGFVGLPGGWKVLAGYSV